MPPAHHVSISFYVSCCLSLITSPKTDVSLYRVSPANYHLHLYLLSFCLNKTHPTLKYLHLFLHSFCVKSTTTATRGHPYKLFKPQCTSNVRSSFFTQRVINVWNDLPTNIVNFSSLVCFRRSLLNINFSDYLVVI